MKLVTKTERQDKLIVVGTYGFFVGVLKPWEDDPTGAGDSSNQDSNERRQMTCPSEVSMAI
jgi:hypothetical protein